MLRISFISAAIVCSFIATALAIYGLLGQGINDGEWAVIRETGLPTKPEGFAWSNWRSNDGSVYPFPFGDPTTRPQSFPEFRIARARDGFLHGFVFYQGRLPQNGIMVEYPALGPNWGFSFPWVFPWLSFTFAILFGLAARYSSRFPSRSPRHFPHATNVA